MPAKKSAKKSVKKSLKKSVKKPSVKLKKAPSKKASAGAKKPAAKLKKLVSAKKSAGKKQKPVGAEKSAGKLKPAAASKAGKLKKLTAVKKKPVSKPKLAAVKKKLVSKPKPAPVLKETPVIEPQESVFVDVGRFETEIYEPDPEVKEAFAEAAGIGDGSTLSLFESLAEETPETVAPQPLPQIESSWDENDAVGEEAVGGGNPTPDQDLVDELGKEVGLSYQDDEPLDTTGKLAERDEHRWELEPQSSEDFNERSNQNSDQ